MRMRMTMRVTGEKIAIEKIEKEVRVELRVELMGMR